MGPSIAAVLMPGAAVPTTIAAMLSPATGPEEAAILRPLLHQPAPSDQSSACVA
jgi:hypothetical protein